MADFNLYLPKVFLAEGTKYENPVGDQCNKYGLEVSDLNEYYNRTNCTCSDVQNLTDTEAAKIIKQLYWDYFKSDQITNQSLAEFIVDSGYNQGKGLIAKSVQEIVNVNADGVIGNISLAAINAFNTLELFNKLYGYRLRRYDEIVARNSSKQQFYDGWINRLNKFPYTA
jgi:lysozyme family protein